MVAICGRDYEDLLALLANLWQRVVTLSVTGCCRRCKHKLSSVRLPAGILAAKGVLPMASLPAVEKQALVSTAQRLTDEGKGILAADESTGTIGKRLSKENLENTEVWTEKTFCAL